MKKVFMLLAMAAMIFASCDKTNENTPHSALRMPLDGSGHVTVGDIPGSGWNSWTPVSGDSISTFSVDFESGLPEGWAVIDGNNDGYTWCLTRAIPSTWTYYASLVLDWYHSGTNAICSGSYINGEGALTPDDYLISPQVNIVNGSTFSFWVAATDPSYPADHFGVFVSTSATPTGSADFTSVQEWTLTAKSATKMGTWYHFSVDLSAYAGQSVYIALRHFNCNDQYIMCIDDLELSDGQ